MTHAIMRRRLLTTIILMANVLADARSARAATPEQIDGALQRCKAYLYKSQQADGTWENVSAPKLVLGKPAPGGNPDGSQWGGITALATYALLAARENPRDPRLARAITFLETADIGGVYALGVRAQVWLLLPRTAETIAAAKRDEELLIAAVGKSPPNTGFYAYTADDTFFHHSTSQYGVLGMWACDQYGMEVPSDYWQVVEQGWRQTQMPDGGWSYGLLPDPKYPSSVSMTAAGVATLFITQDFLRANDGINGALPPANEPLERGLQWLSKRLPDVWDLYSWYGIARVGIASGQKYIGAADWFQAGADAVCKDEDMPTHSWTYTGGPVVGTSFALLFLTRGSAPVVLNKLKYQTAPAEDNRKVVSNQKAIAQTSGAWNLRPRDAANVVRWIGRQMERDLNWQTLDLSARPEDLQEAPILYIAGNHAPAFSTEEQTKIKEYIEFGGLVLGSADAASIPFTNSFKKLGTTLFPGYEWRELPANRPIYINEQFLKSKWKTKPSVLALSNGAREIMLLVPQADPGKAWQTQAVKAKQDLFELLADVYQYATDKANARSKGDGYLLVPSAFIKNLRLLRVARLQYAGDWDPEPGGWRQLTTAMHNKALYDLDVQSIELGKGKLVAGNAGFAIAHLTGAGAFVKLTEQQRNEIKTYIAGGGQLLVDAAGGDPALAANLEAEVKSLFPEQASQLATPLPPDDPLYSDATDGSKFVCSYRRFARDTVGKETSPLLKGIRTNGRLSVVFSAQDLSVGLVGNQIDGIIGYSPNTATDIVERVLLSPKPAPVVAK